MVNTKIKYKIILILTVSLVYCTSTQDMYRLSYYKKFDKNVQNNKCKLRYDGFYYYQYPNDRNIINVMIFYIDGRVFQFGYDVIIDSLLNGDLHLVFNEWTRNCQWCWGSYIISGDTLKCQFFDPGRIVLLNRRQVDEYLYLIDSDSSFTRFKAILHNETIFGEFNDTFNVQYNYYFKKGKNKPDSLNSLMDNIKFKK